MRSQKINNIVMSSFKIRSDEKVTATIINEETKPKKLKLALRDRNATTLLNDYSQSKDPAFLLQVLHDLPTFFPLSKSEVDYFIRECMEDMPKQTSEVQSRILDIFCVMIKQKWLDATQGYYATENMLETLNNNDSDFKVKILTCLLRLVPLLPLDNVFNSRIRLKVGPYLSSDSWKLRKIAMNINLAAFFKRQSEKGNVKQEPDTGDAKSSNLDDIHEIERILLTFCDDRDERVRIMAAEHLASIMSLVDSPHRTLYVPLCDLLNDVCAAVRVRGMRLIHAISGLYPKTLVPGPNKNADIRLVDDAFSRLCNSMHDVSVEVRIEAARLLGYMCDVSEKFLEQTFDKKLMYQLKFLKSSDKYTKYFPSEWSSGRTFGEDTTAEKIDEDLAALIPNGACGAFVTGLEDEYLAVRSASIDAVCHLSQQSTSFAKKALDFLADMFNDEIEVVRLNAIKSLRRLCQQIVLKDAKMETILSTLDDASADSREALRDLLSTCTLHSVSCLKSTMDALLNNLKRYPHDKLSVWNCAKKLGFNHPRLVQPLVADLLGYHPFFDLPEPSVDDAFYVCKLLVILNAASHCPTIKSLFLPHTWRHYNYLRNSNPHLTPSLEPFDDDFVDDKSSRLIDCLGRNTEDTLRKAMCATKESKCELLKLSLRNLDRVCNYAVEELAKFTFLRLFCSSLVDLYSLSSCGPLAQESGASGNELKVFKRIYVDTFRMERLWNLSPSCQTAVLALRLRLLCELVLLQPKVKAALDHVAMELQRSMDTACLIQKKTNVVNLDIAGMVSLAENVLNQALSLGQNPIEKLVQILEPDRESERVIRFMANLIATVPFTCTFKHYDQSEFDSLRIKVTYPDGRFSLQHIRKSHVKEISDNMYRLRTDAFVSDITWTDISVIELSLIYVLPTSCSEVLGAEENFMTLCEPIPVRLYPKPKY